MNTAVEFRNVDILFCAKSGRRATTLVREALASLDAGKTRAEISEATGVVIGVHACGKAMRSRRR